jgi:hypothetical protein
MFCKSVRCRHPLDGMTADVLLQTQLTHQQSKAAPHGNHSLFGFILWLPH